MFPITLKQVRILRSIGFVNISGFPVQDRHGNQYVIEGNKPDLIGTCRSGDGKTAIITMDGQVWLQFRSKRNILLVEENLHIIKQICPNGCALLEFLGDGDFIIDAICENGQVIPVYELIMKRISDHNETFGRQITASGIDGLPKPKINQPTADIT